MKTTCRLHARHAFDVQITRRVRLFIGFMAQSVARLLNNIWIVRPQKVRGSSPREIILLSKDYVNFLFHLILLQMSTRSLQHPFLALSLSAIVFFSLCSVHLLSAFDVTSCVAILSCQTIRLFMELSWCYRTVLA